MEIQKQQKTLAIYRCKACKKKVISRDEPSICRICGSDMFSYEGQKN